MKITIVHNDNKKQLLVSTKTMEKLLERIAKDDSKLSVTRFRDYAATLTKTTVSTRTCLHGCTSILPPSLRRTRTAT